MAIELCSDDPSCSAMSPRISFSHDISQADIVPVEQYVRSTRSSSSSIDFDFCVFRESFDHESSSADELFFDGKILPIEIKRRMGLPRKTDPPKSPPPPPRPLPLPTIYVPLPPHHGEEETKSEAFDGQKQSNTKAFWKFKRSSSLNNCGSGYASTLCPLPLLSRSNSTGSSSPIPKRALSRDNFIPKHQSHRSSSSSSSSSASSTKHSQNSASSTSNQKPPMKKFQASTSSHYNNGVRFNPVLNVPQASLFGLGSIFSHGRDKNKRK